VRDLFAGAVAEEAGAAGVALTPGASLGASATVSAAASAVAGEPRNVGGPLIGTNRNDHRLAGLLSAGHGHHCRRRGGGGLLFQVVHY